MPLTYEEVKKIIEKVPPAEKGMPALVVGDKTYTWEQVLVEIKSKSQLAEKMLVEIEGMKKYGRKN